MMSNKSIACMIADSKRPFEKLDARMIDWQHISGCEQCAKKGVKNQANTNEG